MFSMQLWLVNTNHYNKSVMKHIAATYYKRSPHHNKTSLYSPQRDG